MGIEQPLFVHRQAGDDGEITGIGGAAHVFVTRSPCIIQVAESGYTMLRLTFLADCRSHVFIIEVGKRHGVVFG